MNEAVDRRVLGAFRVVDAITGNSVRDPLTVSTAPLTVRPNRSAIYVVFNAPGMEKLTDEFDPPAWQDPSNFEVSIQDPGLRYLPRRANVQAPRKLPIPVDPATVLADPTVVFNPQEVKLFPSPAAVLSPNWAVIRVSIVQSGVTTRAGLAWAVVQATRTDNNALLATTVSDKRGEALLAIPGLGPEISGSDSGAVTKATVGITLTAWFDPSITNQPAGWIPNPDDVLNNLTSPPLKKGSFNTQIGPGQTVSQSLAISL